MFETAFPPISPDSPQTVTEVTVGSGASTDAVPEGPVNPVTEVSADPVTEGSEESVSHGAEYYGSTRPAVSGGDYSSEEEETSSPASGTRVSYAHSSRIR